MAISPASVLTGTGSIGHKATVYYDRVAMDNLKKALRFFSLVEPRRLPKQSGLVSQMFRYIPFASNTTGGSEGQVGSGIAITTETVSVTVVQYFDFVNFSDLYLETIIDDALTNSAEELGYRAGLTVDTLIRMEFDAGSASTSTATIGANLVANDYRKAVQLLRGSDVKPKEGGDFLSLAHPYVIYDLIADSTAGGFIDVRLKLRRNCAICWKHLRAACTATAVTIKRIGQSAGNLRKQRVLRDYTRSAIWRRYSPLTA